MVYWNLAYFKQLYDEYIHSGSSVRSFCHSRGIKENRFYYWIHNLKLNATSASELPEKFIPLPPQAINRFTEVSLKPKFEEIPQSKPSVLKLTYPNGVVLELSDGYDVQVLKGLITLIP